LCLIFFFFIFDIDRRHSEEPEMWKRPDSMPDTLQSN